ncbi:serine hydrolase domain-containing protein [Pelomonas sp. SE-A7]|uniref:serine hydrolase domain-containing protein n=1 Tax=Pelomonas sp. SE-A7 TaxID=3054953 RepID=UPI00259CE804|nr:serine hydrolase domain-containing protein [Pelomonas sp. SE-A7]MDM4766184.1 serine hydrolase domain-containing protein [Pelomonas sp. SE-A7]
MNHAAAAPLQARIDHYFAALQGCAAPGYSVGLLREGEVLLTKGYGLASLEQQTPLRRDSRLRIASVSKQFTVAAVLLLQAEGRLSLQDDVRRHLPELAALPQAVTLDQLARNTSGLPDMLELLRLGGANLDLRVDRAMLLQAIARCRHLNFEPGSRFLYCNSGFALLGLVVERVSGETLDGFLQHRLFRPLGMHNTSMELSCDRPLPGLATPYLPDADEPGRWRRALHAFEHGGEGGLVSTVDDLLLWAGQLLQPSPELRELAQALAEPQLLSGGHATPYARGQEHSRWQGIACLGHGGLWPGFRTEFLLMPEQQLAVVVISNDGGSNPFKVARELAGICLDRPTPPSTADLRPWQGRWLDAELAQLIEITVEGERHLGAQWGASFELHQEADGSWVPLRGANELRLRPEGQDTVCAEIGAGRTARMSRVDPDAQLPAGLVGSYHCDDAATTWRIVESASGLELWAEGPLVKTQQAWTLHGLTPDLVELRSRGYWMQPHQLLRLERDLAGRISTLVVDTGRIKQIRFQRQDRPEPG